MPATPPPRLTRRTTLGAVGLTGVGLAAVTGCDDPTATPEQPRTVRSTEITQDVRLAIELLPALQRTTMLTRHTINHFPQLGEALQPLLEAQQAHVKLLEEAVPDQALPSASLSQVTLGGQQKQARARVLRLAAARRQDVNAAAGRAESGQFAQLLASMGAGLSQILAVIGGTA